MKDKKKIPKSVSFGRTPKVNWMVEKTAEVIHGDIYEIHGFQKLNTQIGNILGLIYSPYYAFKMPKSEIYLVGSPAVILALKIKRKIFQEKFKIIHFVRNDYYNTQNHKGIKRKFMNWLGEEINGAIVPGKMIEKEVHNLFTIPTEISYHFTKDNEFFKNKPDFKKRNVITIGIQPKLRKGTDIFYSISQKNKNKKFYLLGDLNCLDEKLKNNIKKSKNISAPGFVQPKPYLKKSAYFLLPGRYDAGPIVVTEAMAAGLIPITSNKLGAQDLVKELREDLVITYGKTQDYIQKINELDKLSEKEIKILSQKARAIAKRYNLEKGQLDFKEKFEKVLSRIK